MEGDGNSPRRNILPAVKGAQSPASYACELAYVGGPSWKTAVIDKLKKAKQYFSTWLATRPQR